MRKIPCYVCKKLGRFHIYSLKDYWRSPQTPEGMTADDLVCDDCYKQVQKEVLQYKKEHMEENKRLKKEEEKENKRLKKEEKKDLEFAEAEVKSKWKKSDTIEYKDEYCAILHRMINNKVQFIKAFSDITKEGYRLMAQDEGSSVIVGFVNAGMDSYYYFQKIEYISLKNDIK